MSGQQLSFLNILSPQAPPKEDIVAVITSLKHTCKDCRLGIFHPKNPGLVAKGNPLAKIAVVSEAPGDKEMEEGLPLVGKSGRMWDKWAQFAGIDVMRDCYTTNVIQCRPPLEKKEEDGRAAQRAPKPDEIDACFDNRALRILRAMPNLEVIITLGWVAAEAILGKNSEGVGPTSKSHENRWFGTSILPGVGVFCMVHPSYLLREPTQAKSEKVKSGLTKFRNEYLSLRKIPAIVKQMEEQEPW